MKFDDDFAWANALNGQVARIIKECADIIVEINVADLEKDMKRATDFEITIPGSSIGCRLRRDPTTPQYPSGYYFTVFGDFTIRSWRASGAKTEYTKLADGTPRWYLYGWVSENIIDRWVWIDMDIFRKGGIINTPDVKNQHNRDGQSAFHSWALKRLIHEDPVCVMRASRPVLDYYTTTTDGEKP